MKIVVDENIPRRTVDALRAMKHEVIDLRQTDNKGADDAKLWEVAQQNGALIITTDKGFVRRQSAPHSGILVVRLRQPNRDRIHSRVMAAMAAFTENSWPGQTVVMRDRVRSVRRSRS